MTFLRKLALSASVIALGCSSALAADLTVGFSQIGSESGWRAAETSVTKMEAEKRGYALWHYTPSDLIFRDRKVLDRAKGLLMSRQGLTEPQAHARLRKAAMDKGLKLVEVAQRLIDAADLLG